MSRKLLIATTIALGSALTPLMTFADNATPSTTPGTNTNTDTSTNTDTGTSSPSSEMTKDSWLSTMTPMLPDLICKGFIQDADLKKRFDEIKMTYEQCVTLIPASTTKCQNELYANIPDKINSTNAATWGRALGECIGKDFAEKYLVPKQ